MSFLVKLCCDKMSQWLILNENLDNINWYFCMLRRNKSLMRKRLESKSAKRMQQLQKQNQVNKKGLVLRQK